MNPENLQPASYRGVQFLASVSRISGGRRGPVKRFPNSDRQLVEDLGLIPREFTLSGAVTARRDNQGNEVLSYEQARDSLLRALEKGGVGVLVHPFYGRLENIVVRTFSLSENTSGLGDSPIDITFAISDATGLPTPTENVLGSVISANTVIGYSVVGDVGERFSVTPSFMGNFQDGLDKVNSFGDAIVEATRPETILASELDSFSAGISEFSANVASLVSAPTDLADEISGLFSTVKGLFSTTAGTYNAFVRLFDFGDDDITYSLTTPGKVERQVNRDVINAAVQGLALGHAYEQAARMDLQNVEEIEEISGVLEEQYQKLVSARILDSDVEENLTQIRIKVTEYFKGLRVTKPRIVVVNTKYTTTRLLAFQYYGSSELGETIAKLNDLPDMVGVKGLVRILST